MKTNNYFFKGLLMSLMLIVSASANAHDFEVDGIYYSFNDDGSTVSVSYKGTTYYEYSGEYSGTVVIPEYVTYNSKTYTATSIRKGAFINCAGLSSITIPNSVTSIGEKAFASCSSLTSVEIPNSVTSIGLEAFGGCTSLSSVSIGNGVTSIEWCTFLDCSSLTSVEIPNSVTSIGADAFAICSSLTSVEIPNSVTSIGEGAFAYCAGLTSVIIPNSVTSIGRNAFFYCDNLTTIVIPNGVQSIGQEIFGYCFNLASIYCMAPTPYVLESNIFCDDDDYYLLATLYVPTGSVEAYRNAEIWKKFTNIVEFDPEAVGIEDVKTDDVAGNIKAENGTIVIESTVGSAMIYDMSGRMVENVELNGGRTEKTMPNKGVYVVEIDGRAVKVAL